MEDIINGEKLGPRVVSVIPEDNFYLLITFNNGETRRFDAKPLFSMKVFSKLKNPEFFKNVSVAYGTVSWPDDIDYCPDCLYAESFLVK